MARTRLAERFNDAVQVDLCFVRDHILLHVIDEATRWAMAEEIQDKTTASVLRALTKSWLRIYGAPKVLIMDQEGAMSSEEGGIWCARHGVERRLLAERSHASMIERHNGVFKTVLLRLLTDIEMEGIEMPFEDAVSEAVLAKNTMITIGGVSPYHAVFGRSPPGLSEFEEASVEQADDSTGGIAGASRHAMRVREMAMEAMLKATATDRATRAARSRTRRPLESLELKSGDLVDVYRTIDRKGTSAWRGPCVVVDTTTASRGVISVRWQGKVLLAAAPDVRRHEVFLTLNFLGIGEAWMRVQAAAESLVRKSVVVSWIWHELGWKLSREARENPELHQLLMQSATQDLHLTRCLGARMSCGVETLGALSGFRRAMLVSWIVGSSSETEMMEMDAGRSFDVRNFFGKRFRETVSIQFLLAGGMEDDLIPPQDVPMTTYPDAPQHDRPPGSSDISVNSAPSTPSKSSMSLSPKFDKRPRDPPSGSDRGGAKNPRAGPASPIPVPIMKPEHHRLDLGDSDSSLTTRSKSSRGDKPLLPIRDATDRSSSTRPADLYRRRRHLRRRQEVRQQSSSSKRLRRQALSPTTLISGTTRRATELQRWQIQRRMQERWTTIQRLMSSSHC